MIKPIIRIISFITFFILGLSCQVLLTCPFAANFMLQIIIRNLDFLSFFYHLLHRTSTQNFDASLIMR